MAITNIASILGGKHWLAFKKNGVFCTTALMILMGKVILFYQSAWPLKEGDAM